MTWLWRQINTSYCRLSMRVFILRQGAESVTVVKHLQIHRAVNCRPLCGPTEKMAQEENKFSGALKRNHFGFWKVSHLSSQHSFTDSQGLPHCCFWLQQHTLYWPKTCLAGIQTCPLLKPLGSHGSEKYHKGGLKLLRRWYLQARRENHFESLKPLQRADKRNTNTVWKISQHAKDIEGKQKMYFFFHIFVLFSVKCGLEKNYTSLHSGFVSISRVAL